MKFLPIVWRNLLRRKFRTFFTIGAIFFAFVLFGITAIVNEGIEDLSRSLIPYGRTGIIRIP